MKRAWISLLIGLTLSTTVFAVNESTDGGITKGDAPLQTLFEEENRPLGKSVLAVKPKEASSPTYYLVVVLFVLALACGGTFLWAKYARRTGALVGSRKYLIEQLSYVSLGNKSGASLLKIGGEFVLVGITPNQVTMLSKLDDLKSQYQKDSEFERGAFREVVREEFDKVRKSRPSTTL